MEILRLIVVQAPRGADDAKDEQGRYVLLPVSDSKEVFDVTRTDLNISIPTTKTVDIDASALAPFVTWGTNPGMVVPVDGRVPELAAFRSNGDRQAAERMLGIEQHRARSRQMP